MPWLILFMLLAAVALPSSAQTNKLFDDTKAKAEGRRDFPMELGDAYRRGNGVPKDDEKR